MVKAARDRQRGALLVEALVAFALFLMASVAFFGLLAHSRQAETKARQTLAANALARQLMEASRLKGYSGLAVGTSKGSHDVSGDRDGISTRTRMSYTVTVYDGPGSGVKSVVVKVGWNQGWETLESYVTQ
jgi:type II secretory pathway pseudopilin PulG